MKVLVTGHNGYIGTVLTPMLLEKGHYVNGLDSDLFRDCTFGEKIPNIPEMIKDIRQVQISDIKGFDAIIHLAGLSNDPLGDLNPEITYEINHKASVKLAELAKQAGVRRFIFSSSCSNYGAAGDDFLDEDSSFNPVTPYGKSKVLVEKDLSKMADEIFSPVFLRNATVYGISPRLRFDLVLNNLVAWAFTTGKIHLKSDGMAWRPIVHVEDVCRAFVSALEAPKDPVHNQAFNVGVTEENYLIRDLAKMIEQIIPDTEIEFAEGAISDKRNYRVNCDKIKEKLPGFKATWNAREGTRQLYAHYKRFGLSLAEFEGPRYSRIKHIQELLAKKVLDERLQWGKVEN